MAFSTTPLRPISEEIPADFDGQTSATTIEAGPIIPEIHRDDSNNLNHTHVDADDVSSPPLDVELTPPIGV